MLPFVIKINEWIEQGLPRDRSNDVLFFKSKLILTELVTNAIKHSHTNEFKLIVAIESDMVKLTRIENGNPFSLFSEGRALEWPLAPSFIGKPVMILKDKMSHMFAIINDYYNIEFKLEEYSKDDEVVIDTLLEHFGLIIITKLSDKFNYSYDPTHHLNIFEAKIKF
ncbi:MAG: hypothetical protein JWN56_737 [Sphingobacteriales bacterium]|nr:hypothetical protein [Sphingobacteriales bacterium]